MAKENYNQSEKFSGENMDDMSVLNVLLQTIRGISPISSSPYGFVPAEDDVEL